eukprot:4147132-Pleurochrysis_carterae.AAC.1
MANEERFVTHNFTFRLFTTVLGMIFVNAFNMFNYFLGKIDLKPFIWHLAYDAMHNSWDYDHRELMGTSPSACRRSTVSCASSSTAPPMRVSPRSEAKRHYAVPISSITAWEGRCQERCVICGVITGTCCAAPECSSGVSIEWRIQKAGPRAWT